VSYQPPTIPIVSNVTGRLATDEELTSPGYWTEHIRATVRFAGGIETLDTLGVSGYLELGPDATLSALVASVLGRPAGGRVHAPAMRGRRADPGCLRAALGQLNVQGRRVNGPALDDGPPPQRVELPTYAFQEKRYWLRSSLLTAASAAFTAGTAA